MRTCAKKRIYTGISKCPLDFDKIIGALVVPHGLRLWEGAVGTATELETTCHAVSGSRVFPIKPFVEFAGEGGDANVSAVGYGGNKVVGRNAATFTFTLDEYYAELAKGIENDKNGEYDVYFYDKKNVVYGVKPSSDTLMGIPLSCLFTNGAPFATSGDNATLTISFAIKDIEKMIETFDYMQCDFDVDAAAIPLDRVKLVKSGSTGVKIVEVTGDLDVTDVFAASVSSTNLKDCFTGASAASYADGVITLTATGSVSLAEPATLYTKGVKGFEGTNSITLS